MCSCPIQHLSTVNAAELYVRTGRLEKLYQTLSKEEEEEEEEEEEDDDDKIKLE
jgi:hypothetical protein